MKKLVITTTRLFDDKQWAEYKRWTPLQTDWKILENDGKVHITQHQLGEEVITTLELEEL